MRIRQAAMVAATLQPVVADLCEVLGLEVSCNDPGVGEFGLENAVIPVGDTFLEVVAPIKDGTTAGRLLERRGGDGGYMVLIQVDDLDAARRRMAELDVRVVWESAHDDATTMHLHPKDVGGAILSLDIATPPESWRWAGPGWRDKVHTDRVSGVIGVDVQSADPEAMAKRWGQVVDREVRSEGDGTFTIGLEPGSLRFVPDTNGRGDGVAGITLQAEDAQAVLDAAEGRGFPVSGAEVELCGTRFRLVESAD